ncbi:MAG: saccharopine dehydrogenase [Cyanobacteria bacterium P01_D01_bin.73]
MKTQDAVLIAGGYGVVGHQLAMLIRQRHPQLPLFIAGRNQKKADALAQELGHAQGFQLDVDHPNPLQGLRFRAVVAAVNDPQDHLLLDAVRNGIPYVDITRWPERLRESAAGLAGESLKASVFFASSWMGGVASVAAVAIARTLSTVERIDISVLFSMQDKSGPNSVEYMDRLATPFETMVDGQLTQVKPYTDPRSVTFPSGCTTQVYRFDTPDQLTLPQTTGAKTVAARIAFDDPLATGFLRFLVRSGIWKLISGDRFTSLRRSLLYNPGSGASHEIEVAVTGRDIHGAEMTQAVAIADPQGQTHLTALGALMQLERLLGLDGANPPEASIIYPDKNPQIEHALQLLQEFGVTVSLVENRMVNTVNYAQSFSAKLNCA